MQDEQTQPVNPSILNAAAAIERAKEIHDRYKRQKGYLIALESRLPILESALAYNKKIHKESGEDIERLTLEIAAAKKHIGQLHTWVNNNASIQEDVAVANELAEKIKRLQKVIEKNREELHRLEVGLPETKE